MSKARKAKPLPEVLPEYDFREGVRGKYSARFAKGTNLIAIAPDVSKLFPDSESVNEVLRACAQIIRMKSRKSG